MRRALPIVALLVALLAVGHAHPLRLEGVAVKDLSALDESVDWDEFALMRLSDESVEMIQGKEGVLDGGSNSSTPCNNSSADKTAAQSQAEKDAAATSAMAALGMTPNHTKANNTAVQKNVTAFAKNSAKIQKAVEAKAKRGVGKMEEEVLGKNLSSTPNATTTANASNITQQSSNASASNASLVSSNGTNGTDGNVNLTLSKQTDQAFANATKAKKAQQEAALKAMGLKKEDLEPPTVECDNATNASNASTPAPAPPAVDDATDTSDMPSGLLNTYSELTGNGNGGKATGVTDALEVVAL